MIDYIRSVMSARPTALKPRSRLNSGSCARKAPSFAVALNCTTGSSFLNALVKAFEKLHMVLAANSGYCGLEIEPVDFRQVQCTAVSENSPRHSVTVQGRSGRAD